MTKVQERYDEATETMWVDRQGDTELVPREEMQTWIDALRDRKTADGKPLKAVHYIFAQREAAEYNQQALAFAKIATYVGTLDQCEPIGGDSPSFQVAEDFGMGQ